MSDDRSRVAVHEKLLMRKDRNGQQTPRPVLANVVTILSTDDEWSDVIAHDAFRDAVVKRTSPPWDEVDSPEECESGEWTDTDSSRTSAWLARRYSLDVTIATIDAAVCVVAERRIAHPIRDWLESLTWDGIPRIGKFFPSYFGADTSEYNQGVGARFLIGAVARVYEPGAKVDCTPVLEGKQGIGKSTAIRKLAGDEYFFDTPVAMGDKDGYQALRGKWIGELGELHSLNKADLNRAKNFLTATVDHYRPSFGRRARDFKRRCVFIGSTNASEYLRDETGNRRFWPVRCGNVDIAAIERDRAQLWSEAVARYKSGERWHVDSVDFARLCEAEQEERFVADAWEAPICEWLTSTGHPERRTQGVTTGQVLAGALIITADKWSKGDQDRVAAILRRLDWERGRQTRGGDWRRRERRWKPKVLVTLVTGDAVTLANGKNAGDAGDVSHRNGQPVTVVTQPVTEPVTPILPRDLPKNTHTSPASPVPAHTYVRARAEVTETQGDVGDVVTAYGSLHRRKEPWWQRGQ